jgi:L-asparaginase
MASKLNISTMDEILIIKNGHRAENSPSILVIYTGGTIGMDYDESGKHLIPFDFAQIMEKVPELMRFNFCLSVITPFAPIDSSNINISHWALIAKLIHTHYKVYDAFVILHGTDTMSYTASALSFLLEDLNKPVVLTGSQLPIGATRTDARENFIAALEIAAAKDKKGNAVVPEVCVFFDKLLIRGNRARKVESENFNAFQSPNYPPLASAGIFIHYNTAMITPFQSKTLWLYEQMCPDVVIFKVFPSLNRQIVESVFGNEKIKGYVLESYGAGNVPSDLWFKEALAKAVKRGAYILNVSQCGGGGVMQGRYATSSALDDIGVISGHDITPEAAITKMMFVLANEDTPARIVAKLSKSLAGEVTIL